MFEVFYIIVKGYFKLFNETISRLIFHRAGQWRWLYLKLWGTSLPKGIEIF